MSSTVEVDCGYWRTKFKWVGGALSFRSLEEKSEDKLNKADTYFVKLNGAHYLVGEGASGWNVELDKTNNELHRVAVYTGLGLIGGTVPASYDLVVNYPLAFYNKENKKKFEQFLIGDGNFTSIEINGVPKSVRIRRCTVFPQTVAVAYTSNFPNLFGIVDIGGLTAQGCIVKNMNLVRDSIFSENKGCIIIYNEIRKLLNKKYGMNIQDYEIEDIVCQRLVDKDLFENYLDEYFFNLKQIMRRSGWNIELLDIIYTGGGSLVLGQRVGKLSSNPVQDNVAGLWEVGKVCYGEN